MKSNGQHMRRAAQRVLKVCRLVKNLKSLDKELVEFASCDLVDLCKAGPQTAPIVKDAGAVPVLVDLLLLAHEETSKSTKIVTNSLHSMSILCLNIGETLPYTTTFVGRAACLIRSSHAAAAAAADADADSDDVWSGARHTIHSHHLPSCIRTEFCLDLAEREELSPRLAHIYRMGNAAFRRFTADIVCRMFNQLCNVGMEEVLVTQLRAQRQHQLPKGNAGAPAQLTRVADETEAACTTDTSAGTPHSMTGLLILLLDSSDDAIVKQALFSLETLSYHFDNVVALCEMDEPGLLPRLTNLLMTSDLHILELTSNVINGIVCNGRLDKSVLSYARSGDLLGQLRSTMDGILNEDNLLPSAAAARDQILDNIFYMYCSLPRGRKRFHGPESKRDETLLKEEANR